MTVTLHSLAGWTPMQMRWEGDRPVIRWCFTEGVEFTDSFFDQTIERCLRDPFRLLFWRETDIEALAEFAAMSPGLEPAGLIFHTSRCGSTLLAQMFASLGAALVMSEPAPIDSVLRAQLATSGLSDDDRVDWLRWMASALGQPSGGQTRFVIKLDAWAILDFPLIRRAFPDSACIFVYRDPLEVIASQLSRRGYHMIPGTLPPDWLGLSPGEPTSMSPEDYCAAVLGRLCETAAHAASVGSLDLINYSSLPEAVPGTVAPLFGIDVDASERSEFAGVARRNAKNRAIPFVGDSGAKQQRVTPEVLAAVEARVSRAYESLEAIRLGRS
jgi:gluconate kinase